MFDPYGRVTVLDLNGTPRTVNQSLYGNTRFHQGLRLDTETGMYYNRHRMLDPVLGRFIGRDPLGKADFGLLGGDQQRKKHRTTDVWGDYEYVESKPCKYRDPKGLDITGQEAAMIDDAIAGAQKYITKCCAAPGMAMCQCSVSCYEWYQKYTPGGWIDSIWGPRGTTVYPFPMALCAGAAPAAWAAHWVDPSVPLHLSSGASTTGSYQNGEITLYGPNLQTSKKAYCAYIHETLHHRYGGSHEGDVWEWFLCIGCEKGWY